MLRGRHNIQTSLLSLSYHRANTCGARANRTYQHSIPWSREIRQQFLLKASKANPHISACPPPHLPGPPQPHSSPQEPSNHLKSKEAPTASITKDSVGLTNGYHRVYHTAPRNPHAVQNATPPPRTRSSPRTSLAPTLKPSTFPPRAAAAAAAPLGQGQRNTVYRATGPWTYGCTRQNQLQSDRLLSLLSPPTTSRQRSI